MWLKMTIFNDFKRFRYYGLQSQIGWLNWKKNPFVKLRSRSRSGEGQVRVMKVKETKDLDLRYNLFFVFSTHPHKLFSWLLRGLDKSDGPRMGWYDSSMVRGG